MSQQRSLGEQAKAAIETMGSALLHQHSDPAAIDASRFAFELRVVLQRVFILEAVGRLDAVLDSADAWAMVLGMDLESEMFHVEQLGSDRIWSAEWVGLVRREFGLCGGKWFGEVVDSVREAHASMGSADESLMGWVAVIDGDELRLEDEDGSDRKSGGVFYTPAPLVGYVLDRALDPAIEACGDDVDRLLGLRVCDPACGCGYFLIAAGQRIAERVESITDQQRMSDVVRSCLLGGDVNPMTAEICRWSLWLAADDERLALEELRSRVECADSLVDDVLADRFDVVVGNPPFLNQLGSGTARSTDRVKHLRERELVGGATYTDEASAFFVLGLQIAKDGGRVCMVQPQSVIATRGGAHARERAVEMGWLESLWVSNEHVFGDASVYTCAPCVVVGSRGERVERYSGGGFVEHSHLAIDAEEMRTLETWSSIAAVTMGIPEVSFESDGVVGDVARATADFRDEYYGLAGCIIDDADEREGIKLLTTGLVDLARCWWGEKSTRILKQRWESPRVDEGKLCGDARLARWVESRGVEKVVVATQTKVVEAFVDPRGEFAAVTPMISVMLMQTQDMEESKTTPPCHPGKVDVWKLGAAIGSPVCSMHAMRMFGGAAMHADALKMSARQVMELPMPIDERAWGEGAAVFERLHSLGSNQEKTPSDRCAATSPGGPGEEMEIAYSEAVVSFGMSMCDAYRVGGQDQELLMKWWLGRLGLESS